jgi:DNA-binding beta-propeller fold protein YncE
MRRLLKTFAAVALIALLAVPAARAAGRPFLSSNVPNGKETPAGSFDAPCGVAVSAGRVYVSDYFHRVIDRFSNGGISYETQRKSNSINNGSCGLAIDSTGTVYVNDFHEDVRRLAAFEFVSGPGAVIDSAESTGVAVDPSTDRVYVDDRTYIAVYEPSGAPVIVGGEALRIGEGELTDAYGVAISAFGATEGNVYVADAATDTIKVFGPAGSLVATLDGAGTPQGGFVSLADASLALDPTNGHLLVLDNIQPGFEAPAAVVDEFNAGGAYRSQLPHAIVDAGPSGLAVDGSGNAYVTSGNGAGGSVLVFGAATESLLAAPGDEGVVGDDEQRLGASRVESQATGGGVLSPGGSAVDSRSKARSRRHHRRPRPHRLRRKRH